MSHVDWQELPGTGCGDPAGIADTAIARFRASESAGGPLDRALESAVAEARQEARGLAAGQDMPEVAGNLLAEHAALVAETAVRLFLAERDLKGKDEETAAAAASGKAVEIHGQAPGGPLSVIDESGRTRVLDGMCGTCLTRRSTGLDNAAKVIGENLAKDALLVCHSTLPYGPYPETQPAVCFSYWARHAGDVAPGRLSLAVGITRVAPPDRALRDEDGRDAGCGGRE